MIKLITQKGTSTLSGERKDYYKVAIQTGPVIALDKIARKIADATGYKEAQIKGVLMGMWQPIFDELEDGQSVDLWGMTLQPSLSVDTHATAEECSAKDVKRVRFLCNTKGQFAANRRSITFQHNGKTTTANSDVVDDTGEGEQHGELLPEGY